MTSTARGLKPPFNIVHAMFDTHKYIKLLKSKGLKETQAESIVQIVSEGRELDMSRLATRDQLDNLEKSTKDQLENVKIQICNVEKRLDRLEQEVKSGHRWIIGLIIGVLTLMAAMVFKQ